MRSDWIREVSLEWGAMEAGTMAKPSVTLGITSSAKLRSESALLFLLVNFKILFCFVEKLLEQRSSTFRTLWTTSGPQTTSWRLLP